MSLRSLALLALLAFAPLAKAETALDSGAKPDTFVLSIADLGRVLQFDALFDVLRDEGLAQAEELADSMLPQGRRTGWSAAVDEVYDLRRIRAQFNHALRVQLADEPETVAEVTRFFGSDLGQRVLTLEIAARRAFLDIAQEEAARVAADTPATARDPKWKLIERLIEAGDLVEMNVAGGLSGSLAFSQGLQASGVTGMAMPFDQLAAETWGQEAQLRADTGSWLKAYFGLAYAPLTEDELETYVTFLESPAGRRYSSALFVALEGVFRQISQDLGRAVGEAALRQEI